MRFIFLAFGFLLSFSAVGQILSPVKWTFEIQPKSKDQYIIIAKAAIQDGWRKIRGIDAPELNLAKLLHLENLKKAWREQRPGPDQSAKNHPAK